jgi:DNA-binding MurR/RpiR family transcriptional regulator
MIEQRRPGPVGAGKPIAGILQLLRERRNDIGQKGQRLIAFILENPEDFMGMSIGEIASTTGVSESYVVKISREFGLSGVQHLKLSVGHDLVIPIKEIQEDLDENDGTEIINEKVFSANIAALQDTLRSLGSEAMRSAVDILLAADFIELFGIGSAAPIAADAHYRMMRIGLRTRMSNDSHIQAVSASLAGEKTAVITISHSGSTQETISATRLAKESGAKTIVITGYKRSPIQRYADIVLYTIARETKFRTEAMTSRIAQLAIVDALIANLAHAHKDRSIEILRHTSEIIAQKRF